MKQYLGVACADIHRTNQRPACRVEDDIIEVQDAKLLAIIRYAEQLKLPIISAGDLYNTWKCGYDVVNNTNYLLRNSSFYSCYGNHELPLHSMKEAFRSPLTNTLLLPKHPSNSCNSKGYMPFFVSWEEKPKIVGTTHPFKVLVIHKTVYYKEKPYPGAKGNVLKLLKRPEYNQFDLIISGDNHQAFKVRVGKTLWLNCGCVYRTKANEIDYVPSCWLFYWDTEKKRIGVERKPLPFLRDNVTRDHLEEEDREKEVLEKEWDSEFAKALVIARKKGARPLSFTERLKRTCVDISDKKLKDRIWFFTEI